MEKPKTLEDIHQLESYGDQTFWYVEVENLKEEAKKWANYYGNQTGDHEGYIAYCAVITFIRKFFGLSFEDIYGKFEKPNLPVGKKFSELVKKSEIVF